MGYLIGWTRQTAEVLKELETTGEYRVKEEYIRKKNGDIAGYYLELYRWYTEKKQGVSSGGRGGRISDLVFPQQ